MKKLTISLSITLLFFMCTVVSAITRLDMPIVAVFDSSGDPGSGMQLFVYESGTTTKVSLYKDPAYSSAHTNPVVLNSSGRAAGDYPIYTTHNGGVKLVLAPSTDTDPPANPIWTVDDFSGVGVESSDQYLLSGFDDLAAAKTYVNALNVDCVLFIDEDDTMDESVSFDAEVSVVPMPGNVITTTGYTLTFNGPFIGADHYEQTFSGTGNIVFAAGSCDFIRPEWYGIDGTTDETQINYALADATNIHNVRLMPGKTYTLTSAGLSIVGDYIRLYCEGGMATLTTAADIVGITIGGTTTNLNVLENIIMVSTYGTATKAGILFSSGAKSGIYKNVKVDNFKYGFELYDAGALGIYYNDFYNILTDNIITYDIYILTSATGYVNENRVMDSKFTTDNRSVMIEDGGNNPNNNTFMNCSLESSLSTTWAYVDEGMNRITNCRIENSLGRGILIKNGSANFRSTSFVFDNYFAVTSEISLVVKGDGSNGTCVTDKFIYKGTFAGNVSAGTMGDTDLDAESASGQKDVNLTSTSLFYPGWYFVIDEGESDEEWGIIATVTSGSKITAVSNLASTHDIGSAVTTYGRPNGMLAYYTSDPVAGSDYHIGEIWAFQKPIFRYNGVSQDINFLSRTTSVISDTGDPGANDVTLTAAMLLGGLVDEDPEGSKNWTTDTAAHIVAAIDGPVGSTFECILMNDATGGSNEVVTVVAGAGVTLHGSTETLTEGTNETAKLIFRLTNVTASSEAVDCYILTGI